MTRDERGALDLLHDFVRDWRKEDTDWKKATDGRLRAVEEAIAADRHLHATDIERGISFRAKLGIAISAIGVTFSVLLGLVNLLT